MVSAPGVTSNFGGQWERAGETCASRETWRTRVSSESRATAAQNVYFPCWRESRRRENIEKWNLKINLPGLKSTTFNKWTRVRMWRYWFINTPKIPWKKNNNNSWCDIGRLWYKSPAFEWVLGLSVQDNKIQTFSIVFVWNLLSVFILISMSIWVVFFNGNFTFFWFNYVNVWEMEKKEKLGRNNHANFSPAKSFLHAFYIQWRHYLGASFQCN